MGQHIRDNDINLRKSTNNKLNMEDKYIENINNKPNFSYNTFLETNMFDFENFNQNFESGEVYLPNHQNHNIAKNKGPGRRKINIEYLKKRDKRNITFAKRKKGIMKKAYELSVLTGSEVLLILGNELGQVYTFATPKLRPILSEERDFIRQCLHGTYPNSSNQQRQGTNNTTNKLSYDEYIELVELQRRNESLYGENSDEE